MPLQPRAQHAIVKLLSALVGDPASAKRFCDDTQDFDGTNIVFQGTARQMWDSIITEADKQEKLEELLNQLITGFTQNQGLAAFSEEFKYGFDKRVEAIAKAIKNGQCVLFLGPDMLQCIDNGKIEPFNRSFSHELVKRLDIVNVYYDKNLQDSLSYIAHRFEEIPNIAIRELGKEAQKSFAKKQFHKGAFEKIAALQFPLIISTNPDSLLEAEMAEKGITPISDYYDMSNVSKPDKQFEENKPVIYKIFGSFENPYSILFTDNDRVQFSKNVVKNDPPLPPFIKMGVDNKLYLFLGFNFQEWHLKILIDCLGLTRKEDHSFALLLSDVNESNIEHFIKIYKFYFISEQIDNFLDKVIEQYAKL